MSKKSFNLSLQKKRNQLVLNPIIDRCDQDGSYVADKVVDYVEKALFFERSVGLSKAMNTYVLVKNTLASQHPPDSPELQQKVEDVMKSIISVDGERLAQFLSDPNEYSNGAGTLPASENRSAIRSASPAPQPRAERLEVERSHSSTATAVAEPEQDNEELERERKAQERALKREKEREERRLEEQRASAQSNSVTVDEDDDSDGIEINDDALDNF